MRRRILHTFNRLGQPTVWKRFFPPPYSYFATKARQSIEPPDHCSEAKGSTGSKGHQYEEKLLLTRDFIAKSLYNRDNGYFCTKDVINDLPGPLDFSGMLGEWHYRSIVKQAYESKLSAWMTPVEVFSPHFSHALARYITQRFFRGSGVSLSSSSGLRSKQHPREVFGRLGGEQLVVYEVGGGTGTNALNVLNWMRREEPGLYKRTEYTIVEISERLAERQRDRVCSVHENCHIINADFLEWGMSGVPDDRPCFFIGMEVLDNLPHDKIAWTTPSSSVEDAREAQRPRKGYPSLGPGTSKELCEAVVIRTAHGFREKFRSLEDPVICELVDLCPDLVNMVKPSRSQSKTAGASEVVGSNWRGAVRDTLGGLFGQEPPRPDLQAAFIPTGCLQLLYALRRRLPRHRAILADFDSLPFVDVAASSVERKETHESGESMLALNNPIVSSRDSESGAVTDYDTYMVPLGSADIFFPTCFERLSRLHAMVCGAQHDMEKRLGRAGRRGGTVVKQRDFLRKHGDVAATRTLTGYNPLVEDYRNTSVFLSDS